MLFNPVQRALRNGTLLSVVVGAVVQLQGETWQTALMSGLFTFAVITPAFWLSYKLANHLAEKQRNKKPDAQ